MEISIRKTFGLRADSATVQAVSASSSNGSVEKYGVALTDAELADVDARSAAQPAISNFYQGATGLDGYAGFWVDQAAGGTLVLMTTATGQSQAESYLAQRPNGTSARVEVVSRTFDELEGLLDDVASARDTLEARGIPITGVSVDVEANTVEVGVDKPTTAQTAALQALYGSTIEVVSEPPATPAVNSCMSRGNCWNPAKGGLWVGNVPTGEVCSSGFVASDPRRNIYLFTAGHCGSGSYTHNGLAIGSSSYSSFYQNSPADARIIDIADLDMSNEVFLSITNFKHITARVGSTGDYVGEIVCIQSWLYGVNCGTITSTNATDAWSGYSWVHQRLANFWAHPGDSGNGIFLSSYPWAEGIEAALKGGDDHNNYFGQIANAETADNIPSAISTCTSMTC